VRPAAVERRVTVALRQHVVCDSDGRDTKKFRNQNLHSTIRIQLIIIIKRLRALHFN